MSDPINPNHYKHLPVEAIDIIDAAIEGAPSPQAAAAQSHLLGYALRANQKGQLAIDAGKAEWYAARWLKAIREAEAKASGASETQIDEPTTEPPDGWRWVEVGENFRVADTLNTIDRIPDNWIGTACVVKHCAFRKVEEPTRFYREPTLEDLNNGPIECEYRNSKSEHWQGGLLVHILDSANPFLCVSKAEQLSNQWRQCRIQCRIEVAE